MIDDYYDAESAIISHTDHVLGGGKEWGGGEPIPPSRKPAEPSGPIIGAKRRYSPEGGVEFYD